MQSTQDWQGEDLGIVSMWRNRLPTRMWNLLPDALMWPGSIKVLNIGMKNAVQLLLLQDEQVIETLSPHTAQEALTDGIGAFRVIRCFENRDAAGCGHTSKAGTKFAITITKEILRPLSIGSRFPQLLCGPGVGRRASDPHMDDPKEFEALTMPAQERRLPGQ
jgi:hypothetical protein